MQPSVTSDVTADIPPCLNIPTQDHEWSAFLSHNQGRMAAMIRRDASRYALNILEEEVGELLQEMQVRLWRKRLRFQDMEPEQAWNYARRMVVNLVHDHVRSRVRWMQTLEELSWTTSRDRHPLRPSPSTPEESLLANERVEVFLRHCRDLIRCGDRELKLRVVRLAWIEGHSSEEVSRCLNGKFSAGQVNSILYRVRLRFAARGMELPRRGRDPLPLSSTSRSTSRPTSHQKCRSLPRSSFDCV